MRTWFAVLAVVLLVPIAHAEDQVAPASARPPVADDRSVPMVIEVVDGKPVPARLVIPKRLAGPMKASLAAGDGTTVAQASRLPTVLAGLFLTLSLVFTGLWLVRSRGLLGTRTAAMILAGAILLVLGGAAVLWACPLHTAERALPGKGEPADRVVIEVTEQGESVKLIVHRSKLNQLIGPIRPVPLPAPLPAPAPAPAPVRPIRGEPAKPADSAPSFGALPAPAAPVDPATGEK